MTCFALRLMITVDRISHSANYLDKKQYGIARMSVRGARSMMANLEGMVRIAFVVFRRIVGEYSGRRLSVFAILDANPGSLLSQ